MRTLLATVAACAVLTACTGGTTDQADPSPSTSPSAPSPTPSPTPSPSADPPEASPSSTPDGQGVVRVVMAGDVLMHDGLWSVARRDARRAGLPTGSLDFRPMFADVKPLLSAADLAICHMETPVAEPGGPFENYPLFSVPPQTLGALAWAGFDVCTTASNHSVDQGFAGLRRTIDALDERGLAHTGTARTAKEERSVLMQRVNGLDVAILSYTYGTNGLPVDADKPWSVNLIDAGQITADARRAKRAGADAVLVALHWGDEYQHEPSPYQLDVADAVTASPDVDLVYGHHAHVVQPVRKVNGTWVAFGLGNFVAQQETDVEGVFEGMVAQFDLRGRPGGGVRVTWAGHRPTYISGFDPAKPAMRVYDIDTALRDPTIPRPLRREMRAAKSRTAAVVRG